MKQARPGAVMTGAVMTKVLLVRPSAPAGGEPHPESSVETPVQRGNHTEEDRR